MFEDQWYEAELARSGQSKCKEFRCKQNIGKGELRIGIKIEENDHSGDTLGWYHPSCLWKTFSYKSNSNPRIETTADVRNFGTLSQESRTVISNLISNKKETPLLASPQATTNNGGEVKARASPAPTIPVPKGSVSLFVSSNGQLECNGDTFNLRDTFKGLGGYWNGTNKSWMFPVSHYDTVLPFFGTSLEELGVSGQHTVTAAKLLATSQTTSGSSSSAPIVPEVAKPKYAMAGTINFYLKLTQEIRLHGDTAHIKSRLLEAGAYAHHHEVTDQDYFFFGAGNLNKAREFFCMPDDLPPPEVEFPINLRELGQKQALLAGVEITAEEQAAADALLAAENVRKVELFRQQGEELLRDARSALTKLKWADGGESGGRAMKKAKKNDPPADAAPAVVKILPTTVDELSYESRLRTPDLRAYEAKDMLAARGLSTSGNKDAMIARLVLAGADYAFIKDKARYIKLAKMHKYLLRNVPFGEEEALIDKLLARCDGN